MQYVVEVEPWNYPSSTSFDGGCYRPHNLVDLKIGTWPDVKKSVLTVRAHDTESDHRRIFPAEITHDHGLNFWLVNVGHHPTRRVIDINRVVVDV